MGSPEGTLPLPVSEWRAQVAREGNPRAAGTGKPALWGEERRDGRDPEVIQWRVVVPT